MPHDPIADARAMTPLIRELRDETERGRRLAEPIVEQLVDRRLCRMALVEDLEGLATPPLESLEVYEILAGAEASVPWIAWNNTLVCLFSRFMQDTARREVFADPTWLYAQSTRPGGVARVEGDGYRVSGRWSLVSGCELAEWLFLTCAIEEEGEPRLTGGEPETRFLILRRGEFRILDTWHVGGLRGTGSHDVSVEDAFVPRERSLSPDDAPTLDHPIARLPILCTLVAYFAAQALGVAQAALEGVIELGRTKIAPGPVPCLRDRPAAQAQIASGGAALDAARANLQQRVGDLWERALRGGTGTLEEIGRAYAAAIHAAETSRATVDTMYALGGTSSIYTSSPLERAHRDLHVMLRHVAAQPVWLEEAGRVAFGLAPGNPQFAI